MRVARSFAFVDVSGFTALTERQGDERAVELLTRFRARLREICSRRGVRIAKWLGDGAMLVCVEQQPLVATVLELQYHSAPGHGEPSIAVRSGATSGQVILLEGDDYIGHAVNVAARLCDRAQAGEVLADPTLRDALPPWGDVEATEWLLLRGIEEPLEVDQLCFRPAPGADADPVCGLPVSPDTAAVTATDAAGNPVHFCSDSCHDTWVNRPRAPADGQGSPRLPLIGS